MVGILRWEGQLPVLAWLWPPSSPLTSIAPHLLDAPLSTMCQQQQQQQRR